MEFPFQSIQDKIPVLISKNLKSRYQLLAWKPSYEELTKKVILELHSIIKKAIVLLKIIKFQGMSLLLCA